MSSVYTNIARAPGVTSRPQTFSGLKVQRYFQVRKIFFPPLAFSRSFPFIGVGGNGVVGFVLSAVVAVRVVDMGNGYRPKFVRVCKHAEQASGTRCENYEGTQTCGDVGLGGSGDPLFFITTPGVIRLETEETVTITTFGAKDVSIFRVYLEDYPDRKRRFSERILSVAKDEVANVSVLITADDLIGIASLEGESSYVYLAAEGLGSDTSARLSKAQVSLLESVLDELGTTKDGKKQRARKETT
ncbi:hypothetical protein C0Q70_17460 [Pomacea canaliculata]|uniref:Complement C3/4/5 macroglobulin domain-containing protein n=1 Tax=Pomacea canaliculata TaxID=400727 RepID=A0A2T7NKH7_POMCA|nr:hypothetical protein C0Q70_17460 [Pomacea canaliculata]